MNKTLEQIREELDQDIPRDVVSQRDAGFGGKKLSYLEGHYVIDRLNKVIGQGNWDYQLHDLTKTFDGEVNGKFYVSYVATVRLSVRFPGQNTDFSDTSFIDVGFGDGQDKANPGKCHELAVKEAVTDGIKRCAKSLGMSMGLALYDKTQEHVSDAAPAKAPAMNVVTNPAVTVPPAAVGSSQADPKALKEVIKGAVRVLNQKGTITIAAFKANYLSKYNVDKVADLNDAQVSELIAKFRNDYKELNI
jgi:DNA recombination protein Rad52